MVLTIPASIPLQFNLIARVDDTGNGTGIVNEISESNNLFSLPIQLLASPDFNNLEDIVSCNLGLKKGIFDFSEYEGTVKTNPGHLSTFYSSEADALNFTNQIIFLNNFEALQTPKTIWVRIEDQQNGCFSLTSFELLTKNCEPIVYNAVSPDNDCARLEMSPNFAVSP